MMTTVTTVLIVDVTTAGGWRMILKIGTKRDGVRRSTVVVIVVRVDTRITTQIPTPLILMTIIVTIRREETIDPTEGVENITRKVGDNRPL